MTDLTKTGTDTAHHRIVTIIYYDELSLELKHTVESFPQNNSGRVVLPESFKKNKSIVAVCDGAVKFLNKLGDRVSSEYKLVS